MFGLLNEAEVSDSLNPADYAKRRGRFYLIWNASKICGRPMLVALMAGHAAHEAEHTDTTRLLSEINVRLRKTFAPKEVPVPLEVIVTRWKKDEFTRGTYSYVGPQTRPGDYDLMARSVGNLHFAGEATCGTHPATVHGALLSGLRVASEVMDIMAGPLSLPDPLVLPLPVKQEPSPYTVAPQPQMAGPSVPHNAPADTSNESAPMQVDGEPTIKQEQTDTPAPAMPPPQQAQQWPPKKPAGPPRQSVCATDDSFWVSAADFDSADLTYEAAIMAAILSKLGERPEKPKRNGVNPFLLWTKAKWDECKAACDANNDAGRDNIRGTLGKWWKAASDEVKKPYLEESKKAQEAADKERKEYEVKSVKWDEEAMRIRREYVAANPRPNKDSSGGDGAVMGGTLAVSRRKTNVSNCVVLDHA
jgi:hypothetical protein